MKKCNIIVCFLVLSMFLAILPGCAGNKTNESSINGTNKDKTVNLVWYYPGPKQADHDLVQAEINKKLKDKINAEVSLQVVPFGEYTQKMNVIIASREGYDMCFTANWLNDIYLNISKGAFLPLNDLIKNEAPKLKEALPDYIFPSVTLNGQIYAIPNQQVAFSQQAIYLQKDLADKYGFKVDAVPSEKGYDTLRAIEPYFQKIKEKEPNIYPVVVAYYGLECDYEQIGNGAIRVKKYGNDLKVYNIYETDDYKKQIRLLSEWYKKGYIRKDITSVNDESIDRKNNKYAAFFASNKPGVLTEMSQQYNRDFYQIILNEPYLPFNGGISSTTAISSASKYPEHAIKLIEIMNTDKEIYNMMCFGLQGLHYNKISDTRIEPIKDNKYSPSTSWVFGNQFNAYLLPGQEDDIWQKTMEMNLSAKKSPLFGYKLDLERIKEKISQINSLQMEYNHLFVDEGKRIPEFLQKLKQAGIDDVVAEVQSQVDAWKREN